MAIYKYEVKHVLHNPTVSEDSDKCIFKYLAKCFKLKVVINGHRVYITNAH